MKKTKEMKRLFFWSAAAAGLLFSACTKDESAGQEPQQPIAMERLYLSDEASEADAAAPESRAYFADGYKIAWEEGDEVAMTTNKEKYPVQQDEAGRWYVELPSAESYTVYYPAISKKVQNSVDIFELGMMQTYRAGTFDKSCFAARAVAKRGEKLTFMYMCSMVKVTLQGTASEQVASVRIDGLAKECLSPGGDIIEDAAGVAYISKFSDASYATLSESYITLNADPAVALTPEGVDFYLTMIPATFPHGFTVTVTLADGRVMKRRGGIGQTAARGRILTMPVLRFEETLPDKVSPVLYSMDNTNWLSWKYESDGATPSTLAYPQNQDNMLYFKNNPDAETPGLKLAHLQSLHDTFMKNGNAGDNLYATAVEPIGFDLSQTTCESETLPANIFTRYGEASNKFSTDLRYVSLPSNITIIPAYAFYGNQVIRRVILPASVREIGTYTFYLARGFSNSTDTADISTNGVYCHAVTPPTLGSQVFNYSNIQFHVPAASLADYQTSWAAQSGATTSRTTLVGDL